MDITKLAQLSLEMPEGTFSIKEFTIERAYLNRAAHVTFQDISLVHIDRRRSPEDDPNFANGHGTSERGDIAATIYWLIRGERCKLKCSQDFHYDTEAHCGGVDYAESQSTNFSITPEDFKLSESELEIIHTAAKLASSSKHGKAHYIYEETELPRCFINKIVDECGLRDDSRQVATDEQRFTMSEWDFDKKSLERPLCPISAALQKYRSWAAIHDRK